MIWLALAALLEHAQPAPVAAPSWYGGRIYTSPALHVGLRPAAFLDNEGDGASLEWGAGLTLQVTAGVP